ncbi:MAG: SLC13 family permease [Anaerolineae bacterium]|nr:SLC13 family permease [Anaerolineae bacterium]
MFETALVIAILVVATILFITEWLRVDVVALGVVVALMLTRVLTPSEATAGFSDSSVLTVAALFIVGGGVMQTGLAAVAGRQILRWGGTGEVRLLVVLMIATAFMSAFMSSTGTVAILLPGVMMLAQRARIKPSRLLIPLSFGSLLGGALTLIGTPPNIIVSDTLAAAGYAPFGFFAFTPMGTILLIIGVIAVVTFGRKLLPSHPSVLDTDAVADQQQLAQAYDLDDDLYRLLVPVTSTLAGKTIADSHLGSDYDVTVLKIMRKPQPENGKPLALRTQDPIHDQPVLVTAQTHVRADDTLIVRGDRVDVDKAAAHWELLVQPAKPKDIKALVGRDVGIAEVLFPPRSQLLGRTVADALFAQQYGLQVLGIHRPGRDDLIDPRGVRLQFGDTIIVQGSWDNIAQLKKRRRQFIVLGDPETMESPPHRERSSIALIIMLAMVLAMIFGSYTTVVVTMTAALAMIVFRCLTMDEAYRSINWPSIILIAGMIPMSTALEKVGVVDAAANGLVDTLGAVGPIAVMAGLFVLTTGFTQVISNTATTVIVAPIALTAAQSLGVQPQAFMMAVAIAASMAFATPVASPTNTLVMSAGSYRFNDFARIGLPLLVISLIASLIFLPLLWPF